MEKQYKVLADCRGQYEQEIIDTILENRGIKDVEHFLNPREEDMLPLCNLKNIDKAYQIYRNAIDNNWNITIYADTDTDGVTSGAIITRYTREVQNYHCECVINDGKAHGLIGQDLDKLKDTQLLMILDSLDRDVTQYKQLKEKYDVKEIIILDHHNINNLEEYEKYVTLVSSQNDYDNKSLSGAGVCYKFICYCEEQESIDLAQAEQYSDLAACGILADVMDVSEDNYENRYIVNLGLNNLNNLGLKKILGTYEFNSKAVLFSIAPLVNASVRVGKSELGLDLLLTDDNKELLRIKKALEQCKDIQNIEKERLLPIVREQFDSQDSIIKYAVINTQYGVSGLIGNTVLEEYKCPVLILNDCGNKYLGSMRSVGYGDFAEIVNNTGIAKAMGHEEAAGFECDKDKFEEFISVVDSVLKDIKPSTTKEIEVDAEIGLEDITRELAYKVKLVNKISGNGFKPINFKVDNITEYGISSFKGGKHLVIFVGNVQLIDWNTKCNYDELEDCSIMNEPITAYGELESGFYKRDYVFKLIMQDYNFKKG